MDPVELNIPDYFDIIKHPMDLGTIQRKLQSGEIQSKAEFIDIVRTEFDNALLYNKPYDPVYVRGESVNVEQAWL